METAQPVGINLQPSVEAKILQATEQAEQVVGIFSPAAAQAVAQGVAVEPLLSGFAKTIFGIFHHHTGVKTK